MADLSVISAERSGRNIVSYRLSDGQVLTGDALKDLLMSGEKIDGATVQYTEKGAWVRLRRSIPVTKCSLAVSARSRVARKREKEKELLRAGLAEELSELILARDSA